MEAVPPATRLELEIVYAGATFAIRQITRRTHDRHLGFQLVPQTAFYVALFQHHKRDDRTALAALVGDKGHMLIAFWDTEKCLWQIRNYWHGLNGEWPVGHCILTRAA